MPPIVYGIFPSSPTRSVILTAKLIGLEFTLKKVELLKLEHRSEEYRKINPTQTIPAFEDEDGFQIFDSHAIVTYLVDKYAKDDSLYPKDLKERTVVNSMLHFNNSGLWNSVASHFLKMKMFGKPFQQEHEDAFKDKMSILNSILGTRPYAAGNHITVADICIANSLTVATDAELDLETYTNVARWRDQLKREMKYYDEVIVKGRQELAEFSKIAIEKFTQAKRT